MLCNLGSPLSRPGSASSVHATPASFGQAGLAPAGVHRRILDLEPCRAPLAEDVWGEQGATGRALSSEPGP